MDFYIDLILIFDFLIFKPMQKSIENHLPWLCLLFFGRARVKIELSDQNNLR